jgi:predicted phosphate transport protein (TIGR00153 family)
MAILTNLFGESPFGALESHGEKVHKCVRLLKDVFKHLTDNNKDQLAQTAQAISALETEADKIRNQLHEMLTGKVMMPLSKDELFNILEHQDSMADRAEDISAILTYRDMSLPAALLAEINDYTTMVLKNCELAAGIMSKLDLLVESSFSGRDALTVSRLITELAEREDAVKPRQFELTRKLLAAGDQIPPVEAVLWMQIIGHLAELSKCADRTGNGIRMTLQIKSLK